MFVWFRESKDSEIERFRRIFGQCSKCLGKEWPRVQIYYIATFSQVLSAIKKSSVPQDLQVAVFPVRLRKKETKVNYTFHSFIYSSYSARSCVWRDH